MSRLHVCLILTTLALTGCFPAEYYAQSAVGHLRLMAQREPIRELLESPDTEPQLRERLQEALAIREYASEKLGLPRNGSYTSYVELTKPYVVWSVVATDEFSMDPIQSCFPVVGCVTYRGYYDEAAAEAYADELRQQGKDVFVGGVQAYSTLGWFDDPVVSSMLDRGDILFAEVVFHELAHQVLYVDDDTRFNEAFATVVGEYGVRQWLRETNPDALPKYERWLEKKADFIVLLRGAGDDLRKVYAAGGSEDEKRKAKERVLLKLSQDYETLKQRWGGFDGYDRWFKQPVNNARLASVAVYRDLVPFFEKWLQACEGSIPRFMGALSVMDSGSVTARLERLKGEPECKSGASL